MCLKDMTLSNAPLKVFIYEILHSKVFPGLCGSHLEFERKQNRQDTFDTEIKLNNRLI